MTKEELIKNIQDFIGEGGYVPFEHGYRPHINSYGVGYDYMHLRIPQGKKAYFKNMTVEQLQAIVNDLFAYLNYCQNEA